MTGSNVERPPGEIEEELAIDPYSTERSNRQGGKQQNLDKYLQFINQTTKEETRFSKDELEELKRHFKKLSSKQKISVPDKQGGFVQVMAEVMNKEQFRSQMGLLGGKHHPFLADRMFEVFDRDKDQLIEFAEFASIMDILCNGSEDEKNQFSFALMDENENGFISFEEFSNYFQQVISHWSSLVNSHVRIDHQEMYRIFREIDVDDDRVIRYSEYRRAVRKNPDLVDWFNLLNSAKTTGQTPAPQDQQHQQAKAIEEEKNLDVIKLEKEQVDQIVKIKTLTQEKGKKVEQLKSQVTSLQGQTEEQLKEIMNKISLLSNQMEKTLKQRQDEKQAWDESVLLQQHNMQNNQEAVSQFDMSQHMHIPNEANGPNINREEQLYAQLIDADNDTEMPFAAAPGLGVQQPSAEREDPFARRGTRAPAMTFGTKNVRQSKEGVNLGPSQLESTDQRVSSNTKQEYDPNATLQQWQQKGLLQKTVNGSGSPAGNSSNFQFSQFNYEFTSRNPSMRIEESAKDRRRQAEPKEPLHQPFDDRILRTHDNIFDGSERVGISQHFADDYPNQGDFMKKKHLIAGAQDYHTAMSHQPFTQQPPNRRSTDQKNPEYRATPEQNSSKTYEEILGPNASLNDILNFDFAGRYANKSGSDRKNHPQRASPQQIQSKPSDKSISPIFEVLIKLRQGREHAKEQYGEKHIAMEQVPSKQRFFEDNEQESHNRVGQKAINDDDDVLDPESPINSASLSPLSRMSGPMTASQRLKVNQRHQKRQEMRAINQTAFRSYESQSAVSNKLSQNQGGGNAGVSQQAATYDQAPSQWHPSHTAMLVTPHHDPATHGRQTQVTTAVKPNFSSYPGGSVHAENQNQHFSATDPHSPVPRKRPSEEQLFSHPSTDLARADLSHISQPISQNYNQRQPTGLRVGPHQPQGQVTYQHQGSKSVYDARNQKMDTMSHMSYNQSAAPRLNLSTLIVKPPGSPKAEKEILKQLDEVKSTVNTWLQKLEQEKSDVASLHSKKTYRSKSANINIPLKRRPSDKSHSSHDSDQSEDEVREGLKVIEDLESQARRQEAQRHAALKPAREESKSMTIDTSGKRPIAVLFDDTRPANMIISSKQSNGSNSPTDRDPTRESFGVNTHAALSTVKSMNKSKKDKTFVHFGNDNWNLVLHMLFGIRQSVHSVMYDDVYHLTDAEFNSKLRYELESGAGDQKIWNLKKYEFYDFCPRMFNLIRKFYGINSSDYLKSIGPESLFGSLNMGKINSLKSQCSAGKSGSLFYYTTDGLYMLKTISHDEFEHFKAIMKNYYNHMLAYPHTMITRFFGLHKIKFTRSTRIERVYFVIMANVFNTQQNIGVRYDLKGSTYGRTSRKKPGEVLSSTVALKDCDWLNDKRIINLREEQRNLLAQQLKADTKFFQENNINDYSVLLGITKLKGGQREAQQIVQNSPNFDLLYLEGINNGIEEEQKRKQSKVSRTKSAFPSSGGGFGGFEDLTGAGGADSSQANARMMSVVERSPLERRDSELLLHERDRPSKAFFESQEGGMVSADGKEIYFMGIIDILTNFGTKKWMENKVRILVQGRTVSCLPPFDYGERFYKFMTEKVYLDQAQISAEIKARSTGRPSQIFK